MSIVNRRNALVGWLVIKAGKRAARKKAADATPSARTGGMIAGTLAVVGGALIFWRHRPGGSEE